MWLLSVVEVGETTRFVDSPLETIADINILLAVVMWDDCRTGVRQKMFTKLVNS